MSTQYLKELGFNPINEGARLSKLNKEQALQELNQNVSFFIEHALLDKPVSSLYSFWPDSLGRVYSHPSRSREFLVENQIDPKERGGATLVGFRELSKKLSHTNQVVIHYSPKGEASFSNEPDLKFEVDKYINGQLTLQYFDGEKINSVGVMVSNENFAFDLFSRFGLPKKIFSTEEDQIRYYLVNPLNTNLNIDELLTFIDKTENALETVYKDKDGKNHSLGSILYSIRETFYNRALQQSQIYYDKTLKALDDDINNWSWTKEKVQAVYLKTILNFASFNGLSEVKLMASCGGSVKSTNDIIDLLYETGISDIISQNILDPNNVISLYSTDLRSIKSRQDDHFTCPKCHFKADGPVGNQCPNCGLKKEEAAEEGFATC